MTTHAKLFCWISSPSYCLPPSKGSFNHSTHTHTHTHTHTQHTPHIHTHVKHTLQCCHMMPILGCTIIGEGWVRKHPHNIALGLCQCTLCFQATAAAANNWWEQEGYCGPHIYKHGLSKSQSLVRIIIISTTHTHTHTHTHTPQTAWFKQTRGKREKV